MNDGHQEINDAAANFYNNKWVGGKESIKEMSVWAFEHITFSAKVEFTVQPLKYK